jgi:eukaryotic-like serine/threonine-protein kinase
MPLNPGTKLGPYEILEPLGAGGMGEVYRGRDPRLNRDVAIKVLPAALAGDASRMARLQREAQVLASLSHPHIAALYGLEESDAQYALVMELADGQTLAERISAGRIPLDEALAIARQIGEALECAHDKGIVHRDLKPANIKLTGDGKVKVLDFGLAKAFEAEAASGAPAANSPTLTLEATRAGMILGTAGYMSPEQARGKPVDKRADIWAFGVVVFEMLAGRSAFEGESVSDTLAAVLRADIEWGLLPADTPPPVRRLLERCLERDPKRRLRDIGDAWLLLETPDAPAPAPPRSRFQAWLPWAAAVVIAAAGIGWGLLHPPPAQPRAVTRWTYAQKDLFFGPTLSRDGTRLLYVEVRGDKPGLTLRALDQTEGKPIPGTDGRFSAALSPDGQWMVTVGSDGKLTKLPVTGGTGITIAEGQVRSAFWGDDDHIVFATPKGLMRVPAAGGTAQTLTEVDKAKGELSHVNQFVLPGARAVLFTVTSGSAAQVVLLDLKNNTRRVLVQDGADARYVPTGHLVFIRGNTLFAAPFHLSKLVLAGAEAPVIEGVAASGSVGGYSFSDTGLLVYMEGSGGFGAKSNLYWSDRGGKLEELSDTQYWGTGRLSPDGRHIANSISNVGAPDASSEIWTFDVERRTRTRLTFDGKNANPIWSPDGRTITYGGSPDGKAGLYRVAADGSSRPELLLATTSIPTPTSWSPDGKKLLYSQAEGEKPRIWVLPVTVSTAVSTAVNTAGSAAGKPEPLHDATALEMDAQFSPDGRWVAYVSNESGRPEVYIQPFPGPGAKTRVSTNGGAAVRWARSGREIFYRGTSADEGVMSVDVQSAPMVGGGLRLGLPRLLIKIQFFSTWDTTPDGKRFLVEQSPALADGSAGRRMVGINDWFEELKRRVPVK